MKNIEIEILSVVDNPSSRTVPLMEGKSFILFRLIKFSGLSIKKASSASISSVGIQTILKKSNGSSKIASINFKTLISRKHSTRIVEFFCGHPTYSAS